MLVAGGIDEMLDGLLLGIGFAVGQKEGILLSFGLAVEVFTFSLAVTATLRSKNISRSKTFGAITVMAACFLIGTLLGITFLKGLSSEMLELILSFGLAALRYLVTDELLAEAHEMEETPGMTVAFFGGFLIFLILGMVAYLLSPIDLIPDFIPILGILDDLILVPWLIRLSIRLIPAEVMTEARQKAQDAPPLAKNNWLVGGVIVALWLLAVMLTVKIVLKKWKPGFSISF